MTHRCRRTFRPFGVSFRRCGGIAVSFFSAHVGAGAGENAPGGLSPGVFQSANRWKFTCTHAADESGGSSDTCKSRDVLSNGLQFTRNLADVVADSQAFTRTPAVVSADRCVVYVHTRRCRDLGSGIHLHDCGYPGRHFRFQSSHQPHYR